MSGIKNMRPAIIITLVAGLLSQGASAIESIDVSALIKERSAALVTVKYVLTVNMGNLNNNRETESASETTCTMISADGLLLCSNTRLGGFISMMARLTPRLVQTMSATPKNLEVIVGTSEQTYDAEISAVDSELDLVWIQVTEAGGAPFSFIELTDSSQAEIGEAVVSLRRTANQFGRTPVVGRNHIGGISKKPRAFYILEAPTAQEAGLPVFSANGKLIGLSVIQLPEVVNSTGGFPGLLGSSMSGLQEGMSGFILPAADVARATQRAMEVESY